MLCFKDSKCPKALYGVIGAIVALLILLAVFQAGRFVGFKQAVFSGRLGDNYYRAFEGPVRGGMGMMRGQGFGFGDFPNEHGAAGKIIKINLPTLVVVGPDNVEKTIRLSDDTLIRRFRDSIKANDLKVGDFIVVLGDDSNSDSFIEAKLVRLLPPPPTASTTPN